jgi:glyoxylase-like metal-dependent hydrolase (beta-lactamase superfamily II)
LASHSDGLSPTLRQRLEHLHLSHCQRRGGEALIIDPVLEKVDRYIQLIGELDLKLVKAVDTHLHADHITGLGALRDRTHCITVMGERSKVDVVSMRLSEGDKLTIEGVALDVLYTPGHTDDSYSFLRSAMAVQAAQDAGVASACHIQGGIDAWKKADGPLLR